MRDSFYPDRIVVGSQCERSVERLQELFVPILRQDFPAPPVCRVRRTNEVPLLGVT
jgi:UDP-glucose 6-dehydrogenase